MSMLDIAPKRKYSPLITHPTQQYPVHTEACYHKSKSSDLSQTQLSLYSNHITFKLPEKLPKKIQLKWSLIQSFYEQISETTYFGFSITKSCKTQNFFFTEPKSLDTWLDLLAPNTILTSFENDFFTIKKIDSGNFGDVNLCQDIITHTKYAVKVIKKQLLSTRGHIKHLKSEIKSMRLISHPHCVKLFRVYEEPDTFMLLMEYLPHGTLLSRLQTLKKFSETDVARLAHTLITVLIHFKTHKIIHRDLKLENILMSTAENNHEIKIADFGIASCSKRPQKSVCGTPGFLPPEALAGEWYDGKFDVFSVGVICFVLLTGMMPFSGKEEVMKRREVEVMLDERRWRGISKDAWDFVKKLLRKDCWARPTAEEAGMHRWVCGLGVESGKVSKASTGSVDFS